MPSSDIFSSIIDCLKPPGMLGFSPSFTHIKKGIIKITNQIEISGPTARVPSRCSASKSPNPGSKPIKVVPPSSKKKNNIMKRLIIPPIYPKAIPLPDIFPISSR